MQYAILAVEHDTDFAERTDEVRSGEYWASWAGYVAALRESGVLLHGAGLMPPETATTVRMRGGTLAVQDGPFAEAKEQLGGLFVIDVDDLDTALQWAARCPAAVHGSVEVRPVIPPMS